jgi:hypothetical protein
LTVRCDACTETKITVEPGYALDCLGNDIVVCSPALFDVAEALACKKKSEQPDCGGAAKRKDCDPPVAEYCLVISYDEQNFNPVNALVRDQGCRTNRCEPSRTRESWRLELIDEDTAKKLNVRPTAWSRIKACVDDEYRKLEAFTEELKNIEQKGGQDQARALDVVMARMRAAILAFAKDHDLTHCDVLDRICAIDKARATGGNVDTSIFTPGIPAAGNGAPAPQVPAARALLMLYLQLVIDCICNAFLMPCEECCDPEVVLLACLKIQDGKVIRICNTARTQVLSGTSVRYWLQPLFDVIGRWMESLCCNDVMQILPAEATYGAARAKQQQAQNFAGILSRYSSGIMESLDRSLRVSTVPVGEMDTPAPLDLYNRPVAEVQARLERAGIRSSAKVAAAEEAYSARNLRNLGVTLDRGTSVELVVAPDGLVASIREVEG